MHRINTGVLISWLYTLTHSKWQCSAEAELLLTNGQNWLVHSRKQDNTLDI